MQKKKKTPEKWLIIKKKSCLLIRTWLFWTIKHHITQQTASPNISVATVRQLSYWMRPAGQERWPSRCVWDYGAIISWTNWVIVSMCCTRESSQSVRYIFSFFNGFPSRSVAHERVALLFLLPSRPPAREVVPLFSQQQTRGAHLWQTLPLVAGRSYCALLLQIRQV